MILTPRWRGASSTGATKVGDALRAPRLRWSGGRRGRNRDSAGTARTTNVAGDDVWGGDGDGVAEQLRVGGRDVHKILRATTGTKRPGVVGLQRGVRLPATRMAQAARQMGLAALR